MSIPRVSFPSALIIQESSVPMRYDKIKRLPTEFILNRSIARVKESTASEAN